MMTLNIMLSIVLGTSLAITAYLAYRNYRRSRLNDAMAHQLDEILQDTLAALKEETTCNTILLRRFKTKFPLRRCLMVRTFSPLI